MKDKNKEEQVIKKMIEKEIEKKKTSETKESNIKFNIASKDKISELKQEAGLLGFFEFFVPNLGYLYFRNLNIGELQEMASIYAGNLSKVEFTQGIITRIIQDTLLYPKEDSDKLRVVSKLVLEKPIFGTKLLSVFGTLANEGEDVSFRSL